MTPEEEISARPSVAAKSGDIAPARVTLGAGANGTAVDDFTCRTKHQPNPNADVSIVRLIAGVLFGAMCYCTLEAASKQRRSDTQPVPQKAEPEPAQLRRMLKDAVFTEQLLEQLRDQSVIQQFTDDPEILTNLQRVAEAIEDKHFPDKRNWSNKAVHRNDAQSPERQ